MKHFFSLPCVALAALSWTGATAEPDSPSTWQFRESPEACSATHLTDREFAFLALRQDGQLAVRMHAASWRIPLQHPVVAHLLLPNKDIAFDARTVETSTKWSGYVGVVPEGVLDQLASANSATVTLQPAANATVDFTDLSAVAGRLKACAAHLVPMEPSQYPVNAPVLINTLDFESDDFSGVPHGKSAVSFRLSVDPNGKPAACEIVATSGEPRLDRRVCQLMMSKSKFKPATNAFGQRVASSYSTSFRY